MKMKNRNTAIGKYSYFSFVKVNQISLTDFLG